MAYVRPADLTEENGWFVLAPAPNGANVLVEHVGLPVRKALAFTFYNDTAEEQVFAKPRITMPGDDIHIYDATGREAHALPGETDWLSIACAATPEEGSSVEAVYGGVGNLVVGDGSTADYYEYPADFNIELYPMTMEWFYYNPPTGPDTPPEPDPLIECDPIFPLWPYATPYLAAAGGPPGTVRRSR